MSHYDRVRDLVAIVIGTIASETGIEIRYLGVEIESVTTRAALEAYKRGGEDTKEALLEVLRPQVTPLIYQRLVESLDGGRDTKPPPGKHPAGQPARGAFRNPTPAGPHPRVPTPQPRPRVPTPLPRRRRDPRRDED